MKKLASILAATVLLHHWCVCGAMPAVNVTITVNPSDIFVGNDVTLRAEALPAASYRYQWFVNGTSLFGRTSPILRLQNIQSSDAGTYRVDVMGSSGTLASPSTNLAVWTYPTLAINGQTNVVTEGSWSRFDEGSNSDDPTLSYQWYFNDLALSGETNASLKFESTRFGQSGPYSVVVSNLHAGVVSYPYILSVMPRDGLEHWEWRNPALQGCDLSGVAFGAGVYVAVGYGGALMTSTNGVDWINRHEERFGELQSITYGETGFVATGFPGRLLTSADGTNWTVSPQGELNLHRVVFGNGTYVVGTSLPNGTYLTSSNGQSWQTRTWPGQRQIGDFAFGNGRFVAVGPTGTLMSTNGLEWQESKSNSGGGPIRFANGAFIALNGFPFVSTNGENWIKGNTPYSFYDVAGGNGVFVAAAESRHDTPSPRIYSSLDGLNWSINPLIVSNNVYNAAFAGGLLFITGDDGIFLVSSNGVSWQTLSVWDDVNLNAVTEGGGKRIAVGDQGRVVLSDQGSFWRVIDSGLSNAIKSIAYGANQFALIDSQGAIFTSTNGESWALAYSQTNDLHTITYGAGRFVAVGDNSTVITSTNATTWERVVYPLGPGDGEGVSFFANIQSITYTGSEFLIADGRVASSRNGVLYKQFTTPSLSEVAFGNGIYLGQGGNGIFTSRDLGSWKPALTQPGVKTRCLIFAAGNFLLAGEDGCVYASPNGDYWVRHYTSCQNRMRALALTGDGTVIVAGNNGAILESPLPLESIRARVSETGEVALNMTGIPGKTYRLQGTSALGRSGWGDLATFTLSSRAMNRTEPPSEVARFYRLAR
jgi:hypothetical protein